MHGGTYAGSAFARTALLHSVYAPPTFAEARRSDEGRVEIELHGCESDDPSSSMLLLSNDPPRVPKKKKKKVKKGAKAGQQEGEGRAAQKSEL